MTIFSASKVDIRSGFREQPAGFPVETLTRITFTAPDGTEFELRDQLTNGHPVSPVSGGFNRGTVFVTADGTSATLANALRSGYSMQNIGQLFPELNGGGPGADCWREEF